jgi:hypothetical protein
VRSVCLAFFKNAEVSCFRGGMYSFLKAMATLLRFQCGGWYAKLAAAGFFARCIASRRIAW